MILKVIFGQRQQAYDDQLAPEALECMTEYDFMENPSYLLDKFDEYKQQKQWASIHIVDIQISEKELKDIMNPKKEIKGKIMSEEEK